MLSVDFSILEAFSTGSVASLTNSRYDTLDELIEA